ncbi:dTMP kinase [bacterium]|nr:MAG: dTMP kinase [bacterium]
MPKPSQESQNTHPSEDLNADLSHDLSPKLAQALAGKFLVFDGPDGSGKSTQLTMFLNATKRAGITVTEVREPGGTEIGEKIRAALLEHLDREEMSLRCEMLLYMASRAQLCEQVVEPALKRGDLVVADRFLASTFAYQGAAGGIPYAEIEAAAKIAMQDIAPDATLIFDVDQQTAASRLNPLLDRMEAKGAIFHAKVRDGYHSLVESDPDAKRYLGVDATGTPDEVFNNIKSVLERRFLDR